LGTAGQPVYVSETRNLYRHGLSLQPLEDGLRFDLVQKRGDGKYLYERCGVTGFELRIQREDAIKLKLDITSDCPPVSYPYNEDPEKETGERFNGDGVAYKINGTEHKNIYGLTITSQKEEGTKTELRIKRSLEQGPDIPNLIDELTITAQLFREKYAPLGRAAIGMDLTPPFGGQVQYEYRHFGMFRLTLTRLVLLADETVVNTPDAVNGPLRYYVAGTFKADVFSFGEGVMQ
jgi:hypothetical protein